MHPMTHRALHWPKTHTGRNTLTNPPNVHVDTIEDIEAICYDHACQIEQGVPEGLPHVMANACLCRLFPNATQSAHAGLRKLAERLRQRAYTQRKQQRKLDPAMLGARQAARDALAMMDAVDAQEAMLRLPPLAEALHKSAAMPDVDPLLPHETDEERAARLLRDPPRHPALRRFPNTREGARQRREAKQDYAEWRHLVREQERVLEQARREAAAAAAAAGLPRPPAPPAPLRALSPWGEQVLADRELILRLGRVVPTARVHPLGGVPLHLRWHRRNPCGVRGPRAAT